MIRLRKRTLGILLTLLSIALWVGPIVSAFGSHNWDFVDTVAPSQSQLNDVEDRFSDLVDDSFSRDSFQVSESRIDGSNFSLTILFNSPFDFPVKIKKFEVVLSEGATEIGSMELVEDVEIGPIEKKNVHFSGTLTEEGKAHIQKGEIPKDVEITSGTMRLIAAGVTVEADLEKVFDNGEIF